MGFKRIFEMTEPEEFIIFLKESGMDIKVVEKEGQWKKYIYTKTSPRYLRFRVDSIGAQTTIDAWGCMKVWWYIAMFVVGVCLSISLVWVMPCLSSIGGLYFWGMVIGALALMPFIKDKKQIERIYDDFQAHKKKGKRRRPPPPDDLKDDYEDDEVDWLDDDLEEDELEWEDDKLEWEEDEDKETGSQKKYKTGGPSIAAIIGAIFFMTGSLLLVFRGVIRHFNILKIMVYEYNGTNWTFFVTLPKLLYLIGFLLMLISIILLIPAYKRIVGKLKPVNIIGMISIITGLVIVSLAYLGILALSGHDMVWWSSKDVSGYWRLLVWSWAISQSIFTLGIILALVPVQKIIGKIITPVAGVGLIVWYFTRTDINIAANVHFNYVTWLYALLFISGVFLLISAIRRKTQIRNKKGT